MSGHRPPPDTANPRRPPLVAVAHGTRDPEGIAVLHALLDRVRSLDADLACVLAFVDHEPPSVSVALRALADEPHTVVVPLLLTAASHSKGDVPGSVQRALAETPGRRVVYGRPLGPHPLLLTALADRLAVPTSTAVVLAAAGAADPDANAEVAKVARLLWEWRGGGAPVEPAYASATTPTVVEAVDRLRRLGYAEVAVAPYFLAPGLFTRAVTEAAGDAPVAPVLGDHPAVAELVLERYAEALAGDLRMNCDTCVYRAPWPGHERRVGAPQRPHTHPADLVSVPLDSRG